MALIINGVAAAKQVPAKKKRSGHTKPMAPSISLDEPGWLRVAHFQALLGGLSHSAFYERLRRKRLPPPDGYDNRPYWDTATVKTFLATKQDFRKGSAHAIPATHGPY